MTLQNQVRPFCHLSCHQARFFTINSWLAMKCQSGAPGIYYELGPVLLVHVFEINTQRSICLSTFALDLSGSFRSIWSFRDLWNLALSFGVFGIVWNSSKSF